MQRNEIGSEVNECENGRLSASSEKKKEKSKSKHLQKGRPHSTDEEEGEKTRATIVSCVREIRPEFLTNFSPRYE